LWLPDTDGGISVDRAGTGQQHVGQQHVGQQRVGQQRETDPQRDSEQLQPLWGATG
jgi:hypothetical protein